LGGYTITVCYQPTRLTQPCIHPGPLNRVPASAGGKGWNVTSAGWQVTLCDPIWHVCSSSGEACCELLYPVTYYFMRTKMQVYASAYVDRVQAKKPCRPLSVTRVVFATCVLKCLQKLRSSGQQLVRSGKDSSFAAEHPL